MAINIRCNACKAEMKLSSKKCKKCGAAIPKNKTYKVIVRMNGQRVTKTVHNLELAREIESKLKVDIARKDFDLERKKPAIRLCDVWKRYLPWAKENKKTWRDDFYNYKNHIEPLFGKKQLDQISSFDIEKMILSLKKQKTTRGKPYAMATIKHQIVFLSRLYSIANHWGLYTGDNPCQKVKKPKLNNQVTEYLTDDELTRLQDTLKIWPDKMSSSFVKFALCTGLRRGEMFKLTWNDIDFDRNSVTLIDPKGKENQTLPLSEKAIDVLRNIPKNYDTPYIFYGRNGKKRVDFKGPWQGIKKAAGLPDDFRLHGLRHHFASALVSGGVDLYIVQKLLTHKDASTTQRYAHLHNETLRNAVNLSDELLEPRQKDNLIKLERRHNG